MIALVRDQLGRIFRRRGGLDRRQIGCGRLERARQGRGVAPVGGVDLGRDDGAGVEIDRMLGLVGQPGTPVLHLGDLRLRVAWRGPVRVGQPLACCGCDPAGSGHPPSVSRCHSPWPTGAASRGSLRRCRGGRSRAAPRWPPSSRHRRQCGRPGSGRARPSRCSTQVNTASCTSSGRRERVLLSQEWSGTDSLVPSRRNSRSDRLSAQRHSRPRSLSMPSK